MEILQYDVTKIIKRSNLLKAKSNESSRRKNSLKKRQLIATTKTKNKKKLKKVKKLKKKKPSPFHQNGNKINIIKL